MKKIYLAIPYSGMEESSYKQATEATAVLLKMGFNVFSPITHSHPLKEYDMPGNWEFWEKIDYEFLDWCNAMVVLVPKEGSQKIKESTGVQAELKYIKDEKQVQYVTIDMLKELLNNKISLEI